MSKFEEIEPILHGAVDEAINFGFVIVAKDWGVAWDAKASRWVWDHEQMRVRGCCVVGAYLLTRQPAIDPALHKGDAYDAAQLALGCDRWWLRDFMNGCDGWPLHTGHDPLVYEFGASFRRTYRSVDVEILELLHEQPRSETRLRVVPSLESEKDLAAVLAR